MLAILSYALFLAIGLFVAHKPPGRLDSASHALVGHGNLVAWILSWALYMQVLAPVCIALVALAIVRPHWRVRVAVSLAVLLVMWFAADQLQHLFARPRRLDWVVKHETAFSYPSSHASLAVAFYGFWAFVLARGSELTARARRVSFCVLTGLVVAVCWARLALGAHYPSDVAGGVLLGLSGVSLAVAVCAAFGVPLYEG